MNTADMQKRAFDAVEKLTPISASQIAACVRTFAGVEAKRRLMTVADILAEKLVDLGVETYGDLRFATCSMYVDECGVKPIDAGRLVAHFAPPEKVEKAATAPRSVVQGVRAKMRFVVANRGIDPAQGRENDVDCDDGYDYEERQQSDVVSVVEGQVRSASQPAVTDGSEKARSECC